MVAVVEFSNNKKAVRIVSKAGFFYKAKTYWKEALVELRKVVWPTKKETIQATLAVVVMVFVMCILMWTIDTCLVKVVAKIVSPI